MKYLPKILWLVPLAAHLGFLAATAAPFSESMGATRDETGVDSTAFFMAWIGITAAANLSLLVLHLFLPRLPGRFLLVPGHRYWLGSDETRAELLARIRFTIEASLLGLNVFLAAVYQLMYESSVRKPVLYFSPPTLIAAFMVLPILAAFILMGLTMLGLRRDARKALEAGHGPKETDR
ncbi:MAG: hypothetical protein MUC50_03780 [Myxococcota bacterium]|nr:hypothetical protein [Myxococcota bacterium]